MSAENCTHNCSTCGENCASRTEPQDLIAPLAEGASVKHVYAVVSGKGGVGKSLVTSLLGAQTQLRGYNTAILDADVTGPSIPQSFGVHGRAQGCDGGDIRDIAAQYVFDTNILTVPCDEEGNIINYPPAKERHHGEEDI